MSIAANFLECLWKQKQLFYTHAVNFKKGFPTVETFLFKCVIWGTCSCNVPFEAIVYGFDIPESRFFKVHLSPETESVCLDCVAVRKLFYCPL